MTEQARKIFDILGVEPNENFKIKDEYDDKTIFHITDKLILTDDTYNIYFDTFRQLLAGEYTIVKLPKKKKLRDLTEEEYEEWSRCDCENTECKNCPFNFVRCSRMGDESWVNHKDMYSDKFLDQEIEIKQ